MKKLYILSLFFTMLFSSTSFSQWWQKGGDLIWPYGDVSITNGDLSLTGYFTFKDIYGNTYFSSSGSLGGPFLFSFGDQLGSGNSTYFKLDDTNVSIILNAYLLQFGDIAFNNSGTNITLDDNNNSIVLDSYGTVSLGDISNNNNSTSLVINDNTTSISFSASNISLAATNSLSVYYWQENVSNPPTKLDLDGALGTVHPAGSIFIVDDTDTDSTYFVVYDGTSTWFTTLMSKAP